MNKRKRRSERNGMSPLITLRISDKGIDCIIISISHFEASEREKKENIHRS